MKWIRTILALAILINAVTGNLPCPSECECYFSGDLFHADCSKRALTELPSDMNEEIEALDLSNNEFTSIPPQISSLNQLKVLIFSGNKLKRIENNAFRDLIDLEILDLSDNIISSWEDLNLSDLLRTLTSLKTLSLSKNKLNAFTNEILVSDTLQTLKLSDCGITNVNASAQFNNLTSLQTLILSHNPIRRINIGSSTMTSLDVSFCELTRISENALDNLQSLTHLYISHNYRLDLSSKYSVLKSSSIKYVDASFCNMNQINLSGISNVTVLHLRGNMLRQLTGSEFVNNPEMTYLDLSSNALATIHQSSFNSLKSLRFLNLSVNIISKIHDETFMKMTDLKEVLLFRNLISRLDSIKSTSIIKLDLSICEIQYMDPNALAHMPSILEINLSRNMIGHIPSHFRSHSLQVLNLDFNRISNVDVTSFSSLPKLTSLHLSENRFISTWKIDYFDNNTNLLEIYLEGNMWRCDCADENMKYFFTYLTNEPPKVWDMDSLICHSPADVNGDNWLKACYFSWYPHALGQSNKPLNFLIAIFCAFFICFVVLFIVRKTMRVKLLAEEEERRRLAEEARERYRESQIRREQEALRNAPDPRDVISPPSYAEALLMPRLEGSFHSLSDLSKEKQKRARRRTRSSGDLLDDNTSIDSRRRRRRSRDRGNDRQQKRSQSTSNVDRDDNDNSEESTPLNNRRRRRKSRDRSTNNVQRNRSQSTSNLDQNEDITIEQTSSNDEQSNNTPQRIVHESDF